MPQPSLPFRPLKEDEITEIEHSRISHTSVFLARAGDHSITQLSVQSYVISISLYSIYQCVYILPRAAKQLARPQTSVDEPFALRSVRTRRQCCFFSETTAPDSRTGRYNWVRHQPCGTNPPDRRIHSSHFRNNALDNGSLYPANAQQSSDGQLLQVGTAAVDRQTRMEADLTLEQIDGDLLYRPPIGR